MLSPLARLVLAIVACALALLLARLAEAATPTRAERGLLRAINDARAAFGLSRVRLGSSVQTSAHRWARYLLRHDSFYHARVAVGTMENLGWLTCRRGWGRQVVQMWLASPSHRAALLYTGASRVGVGAARGSWTGFPCARVAVARLR